MRLQLAAAHTALLAGVSSVDAALPVRRTASDPSNEPNHDANNYDEDEYWSTAFSAILSQDPSAQRQQQRRDINPDDWRRYVRELDDLPDGEFSSLASSSSTTATAPNNAVGESSTDGANNHRRKSRFHIDDVPSLSDSAEGRRILQQQAVTLDDLLGPITVNGPPPPPPPLPPGANDADGINRAEVPAGPDGSYYGGGYKKEDDPMYRWEQGGAETPGYENAADGPGALAKKKDWQYYNDKDNNRKKDRKKNDNKKKIPDYYSPQQPHYPNGAGDPDYKPRSGTYVNCPYGGALQVKRIGYPVCLGTNEILCKNDWKFGIIRTGYGNQTKSHLELRRGSTDNNRIPDLVYRKFPTANTLCIAEYPQNLAILSVGVAGGTWYLACPNAGNPNKLPRLKIVEDADGGSDRHQLVVRFRDGAGTDDALWEIFADGRTETANECAWFFIEAAPVTLAPSLAPSSSPSATPTLSARPSSEPSASPTPLPTASPSSSPTSLPSAPPSSQPSKSPSASPSSAPSESPSKSPSASPSLQPSSSPSLTPSATPSTNPTTSSMPSTEPSAGPSATPTLSAAPSVEPSSQPTRESQRPSTAPSGSPSALASAGPSSSPSSLPSSSPTIASSASPSNAPSERCSPPPVPSSLLPINITLIFEDSISNEFRTVFDESAARWADIIVGDLPDFPNDGMNDGAGDNVDDLGPGYDVFEGDVSFSYTGPVDDVVIGVELADLNCDNSNVENCNDGITCNEIGNYCFQSRIVGTAGTTVTQVFDRNGIPNDPTTRSTIAGVMKFDRLNFECCYTDTSRQAVTVHEMGHVLGVGLYDQSGTRSTDGSFQEQCRAACLDTPTCQPSNGNILEDYPSWQINPPTPVDFWQNCVGDFARGVDTVQMEDRADCTQAAIDNNNCGSGSVCSHWEQDMFPTQSELDAAGASDYMQAQDIMMWLIRAEWASPITWLSAGTLADVGYDDGSNVRVDFSKADDYPVLKPGVLNRGDSKMLILDQDIDFTMIKDGPPGIEVKRDMELYRKRMGKQKAQQEAQTEAEKAQKEAQKEAEKAQKKAQKAAQKAAKVAAAANENSDKNEVKEGTGVMLEEEEMVFLSLAYNRGLVETDSEFVSVAVRQRRGRRRAHAVRRGATATTKNRRETMAK